MAAGPASPWQSQHTPALALPRNRDRANGVLKLLGSNSLVRCLERGDTNNAVGRRVARERDHFRPVQLISDLLAAADDCAAIFHELSDRSPIIGPKIAKSAGPEV